MVNKVLQYNPPVADENITTHGSDWYWAVTAVMIASSFLFTFMMFRVPRANRIFHYITIGIVMVASIAYYSMASNLGGTPITVEFMRTSSQLAGTTRQVFYARYIDWAITTPLLLLDLLLTAGLPWPTVLFTVLVDEVMIVTGLLGALTASGYKWGYFLIGCFAFFLVVWQVIFVARTHAIAIGTDVSRLYLLVSFWTIGLWTLYPIAWGLSEGGNRITSDSEAVFYGILDILAKPVFGFMLLWGHRNIDPARLGLAIADPFAGEKGTNGHHGVRNGATGTTGTTTV